ncbi:hypothetical protein CLAFUW4_02738 [Fulvia fulva]|uniref:uncharacterized protein n=1 Tax=Passalora fulva TaxID=5499 RepID=UPI002852A0D1|nr:uncharacterized protein CLAFUR5_20147 [Fulvia fulva]KAK4631672.1 hypothetical protein CLAFUR4_02733 [Fulvia fulva]KAK4633794.1 hypothetical protein CLAFUR0_02735 [Fulvia fulva]WMI38785.1 hypothetical protein CLAFUR5_20147 [Fulvia fulva]WPV11281.1 hypothetical protein CLAFUW4_02738 [Fulvia fulva]WPV26721.1 hypothetical protein CLAFUW7_02737 [Fulvia fulva]
MPRIPGDTEEAKKQRRIEYEKPKPWTPAREDRAIEWHDRLLPFVSGEQMSREIGHPLDERWIKKVSPFPWAELRKLRDQKLRRLLSEALSGSVPPELTLCIIDELVKLPGALALEVVDERGANSIVEEALPMLMQRLSLGGSK